MRPAYLAIVGLFDNTGPQISHNIYGALCTHINPIYIQFRMCTSIFTHISVHISPFWLTRRDRGAVLDLDCGRSPRTCHDDQWLVRSSGGELGGNDLAALCSTVAPTLASHPPWMLLFGYASTNRKCTVDSPLLTTCDVITADNRPACDIVSMVLQEQTAVSISLLAWCCHIYLWVVFDSLLSIHSPLTPAH